MENYKQAVRLRIYLSEDEKYQHKPLYEEIVKKARELNLAGATVTRGIMGYGAGSPIHSAKFIRLNEDLPIIIEIVDREANIKTLMPYLKKRLQTGCVTLENLFLLPIGR